MSAFRSADATVSAHGAVAITPSDTAGAFIPITRAVYVGTTGDLNVIMADGQTALFATVPVGVFPIQVQQVLLTSTTASDLVALY